MKITAKNIKVDRTFLLVANTVDLEELKNTVIEVRTLTEGKKMIQLDKLYLQNNGEHNIFKLPISHQIELVSLTFWHPVGDERVKGEMIRF